VRQVLETPVERALVIAAHPDDVDFLASGTVASWTASGTAVSYCIVTDGDAGGFEADTDRAHMPTIRRDEQRRAAEIVGVSQVDFLEYPDGAVEVTGALRSDLTQVIRSRRPQRVIMHSPEINWSQLPDFHPDHRRAGEATLQAVYPDSRNAFAHPALLRDGGLQPWSVEEIWMMGSPRPNRWVDITEHFATKMQGLWAHSSQTSHLTDLELSVRRRLEEQASAAGLESGRLAEAFQVVDTR
jgi:LmbE family N-acetylglucosaminyl deacetylase